MRENLFLYFEILSCPFQFSPFEERCDKETGECNVEDVNESVDETEGNGDSNVKVVNDIEGEIARVGNMYMEMRSEPMMIPIFKVVMKVGKMKILKVQKSHENGNES